MRCLECGSAIVAERPERTAQGYRRFRCRPCSKQFSERSSTVLNRAQYPSDVIALVDVLFSEHRDMAAARAFSRSADAVTGVIPGRVTTDGYDSYPRAIRIELGKGVRHRTSRYKNIDSSRTTAVSKAATDPCADSR